MDTVDGFKILVNRLPPHLQENQFYDTLQSSYIEDIHDITRYFVAGYYPANSYESPRFSRAYLKFDTHDKLNEFLSRLNEKFVFSDERMKDLQPIVKPCPEFPEMPEGYEFHLTKISNSLDNNELYQAFLRNENDFKLSESDTVYRVEDVIAGLKSCSTFSQFESILDSMNLEQKNIDKKLKSKKSKGKNLFHSKKNCTDLDDALADLKASEKENKMNNSLKEVSANNSKKNNNLQPAENCCNSTEINLLNNEIEIASTSLLKAADKTSSHATTSSPNSKKEKSKKKSKKDKGKKSTDKNQSCDESDNNGIVNNTEKVTKSKSKLKNSITNESSNSTITITTQEITIEKAGTEQKVSKKKSKRSSKESSPMISNLEEGKTKSKNEKEISKSEEVKEQNEKKDHSTEHSKEKKKKKKGIKKKKQEIPIPGPSGTIEVLQRKAS